MAVTKRWWSGGHRVGGFCAAGLALSASAQDQPLDWRALEAPLLYGHIQLTSRDQFVKAGEAYFSPDGKWIIFQAVPVPEQGKDPDPFYSMYVAELTLTEGGAPTGIKAPILISPPGSANTCGWFHPADEGRVIFGSTLTAPLLEDKPGFKVGTNKYAWSFPEETEVVSRTVGPIVVPAWTKGLADLREQLPQLKQHLAQTEARIDERSGAGEGTPVQLRALRDDLVAQIESCEQALRDMEAADPKAAADAEHPVPVFSRSDYDAECSYSADGRLILYSHVGTRNPDGSADADIWVYDTKTAQHHALVEAQGYDGGPFFSPDGKYITYRCDRKGDNKLQLFVSKLKWGADGAPAGIEWERALTDNEHVNWCPYWHPSGNFLVYATSEIGHHNYEVYAAEVSEAFLTGEQAPADVPRARVTSAGGADVLPAFSPKGDWMMWTAQRGPMVEGESKPSSQLWLARVNPGMQAGDLFGAEPGAEPAAEAAGGVPTANP
jgi:hypothetical protein